MNSITISAIKLCHWQDQQFYLELAAYRDVGLYLNLAPTSLTSKSTIFISRLPQSSQVNPKCNLIYPTQYY